MSIRPVRFNADGSIDAVYDEEGHTGTIPAGQVVWAKDVFDRDNHNYIVLVCPDGCGASSVHPVGGGAAPIEVQQLFVDKTQRDGCACGVCAAGDTTALPESHVRLNCNRMDGPGRWTLA